MSSLGKVAVPQSLFIWAAQIIGEEGQLQGQGWERLCSIFNLCLALQQHPLLLENLIHSNYAQEVMLQCPYWWHTSSLHISCSQYITKANPRRTLVEDILDVLKCSCWAHVGVAHAVLWPYGKHRQPEQHQRDDPFWPAPACLTRSTLPCR